MKDHDDINRLLSDASAPEPRRELRKDFTEQIVAELRANSTPPKKGSLMFRLFHKPALVALLISLVVAIGGSTYAATNGFTVPFNLKNIFGYSETSQDDGSQVLSVQLQNCSRASMYRADDVPTEGRRLYVRIKDNATITTEEALKYVQGYCESLAANPKYVEQMNSMLTALGSAYTPSVASGRVTKIDGDIVMLSSTYAVDSESNETQTVESRIRINNETSIESDFKAVSRDAVRVGQFITALGAIDTYSVQDSRDIRAEMMRYIYIASDELAYYYEPSAVSLAEASLERVAPCSESARFCNWLDVAKRPYSPSELDDGQREAYDFLSQNYNNELTQIPLRLTETPEGSPGYQKLLSVFTPELTESMFYAYGANPIMCAQSPFSEMRFSKPNLADGNYSTVVLGRLEDGDTQAYAEVIYDPASKRISSINCTAEIDL